MSKIQKSITVLFLFIFSLGCIYCVVITSTQSAKELQLNYFRGIVIDKGIESGRSSYRWIIADWTTADGLHIGQHEINASGQPINRISVGDIIYAEGSPFLRGFFWWPMSSGAAYYPSQINIAFLIVTLLIQILLWIWVIILIKKIWKLIGKKKR